MNLLSALLKLFIGSANPTSKDKSSNLRDSEPRMEAGEKEISICLNSLDHRRLRGQIAAEFGCKFWYASGKNEIYVYAFDDFSESKLPIGIIPQRYNKLLLPFINREYEVSRYRASFNKDSEIMSVLLSISTAKETEAKQAEEIKYWEDRDKEKQEAHALKMAKPFCIKEDLEQIVYISDNKPFKGKEELGELKLEFHEKEKYLNPKFQEVMIIENGKPLCIAHLSIRLLRTYYSGNKLTIKKQRIEKEKAGRSYNLRLHLVIGLKE